MTGIDRGRNARYRAPPAQIRTGPIKASGSYLGCLAARCKTDVTLQLSAHAPAPGTRFPGSEFRRVLCWPVFPLVPALRSTASAAGRPALFGSFVATMAKSDFSCPYITGYGSSPSRCGPGAASRLWSDMRSPGSRTRSVRTCQGLRPRWAGRALAIARPSILPSATRTASAPRMTSISRLNGWPMRSPADASPMSSRTTAHGSGPMWFAIPSPQWTLTTYSLPVSRRTPESTHSARHGRCSTRPAASFCHKGAVGRELPYQMPEP